jgi:hypothetical protein
MSDRPQGSVRTDARVGDAPDPNGAAPGAPTSGPAQPVSATQSIPTGGMRAQTQAPSTGTAPAAAAQPAAPPFPPAGSGRAVGQPTAPPATATRPGARPPRKSGGKAGRGPRRARLQLRHIDTWSAFKISFVLSVALFLIWMIAVAILYGVLSALGVFNTINDLFGQLGSASGTKTSSTVITPGIVLMGAAVIGAINVILMTALCTVATFIYNMCADLVGGLEVTLSERD